MIIHRLKFTTEITLYGISGFHYYRWNQFTVIPMACTLRTTTFLPKILSSCFYYVPEDIAMHSLYAKITSASTPLFPDVYFVSCNRPNCVFIVSSVAILGYNICVCHLLSNKEISSNRSKLYQAKVVTCFWDTV